MLCYDRLSTRNTSVDSPVCLNTANQLQITSDHRKL